MSETAGWEVEGFIERLNARDDKNSERLVLEAISHLRAFSRDCDALRDTLAAERERCATVAENFRHDNPYPTIYAAIAAAIRKGE